VNLLRPAPRELARILGRLVNRLRLVVAARRLAKAETNLGLLGWQQADFAGEAQRHIDQLTNVEREQARLTNESARLGLAIQHFQDEGAAAQRQFEETRRARAAERVKVAAPVEETARQCAERERLRDNFAARVATLARELADADRQHAELLAAAKLTPDDRAELGRLRQRTAGIPTELADLRLRQQRLVGELRPLQEALARGRAAVAVEDEKLRVQQAAFAEAELARKKEVADFQREKQAVEKEIASLEKAKGDPYRRIGQVLADAGIAPMNQPHALAAVQQGRAAIALLAQAITASLAASRREDRTALQNSWGLWAVTLAVSMLILLLSQL
jgi:chromosome segregation ATPase